MCESTRLYRYLDLGFTPLADRLLSNAQLDEEEIYYPLRLVLCEDCGLHQLDFVVDPVILYQKDYPYDMSTTMTGGLHWKQFAQEIVSFLPLKPNSLVIDIGSNSGVLLQKFKEHKMRVLGVDPAMNIVRLAIERGIPTICDFFDEHVALPIVNEYGKASLITGSNVFAHIDNLQGVMRAVNNILTDDGVFIFESPHCLRLIQNLEYDTIYHEHLSYLSIKPVVQFVKRFDMEVCNVFETPIHGGSIRVMICRKGARPISRIVEELISREEASDIYNPAALEIFAQKVAAHRASLVELLDSIKRQKRTICCVSAPAKGMTLLNYCNIRPGMIDFCSEKSPLKIGRYTPGGHIPIVSDESFKEKAPDFALLLAWNFASEIIKNLSDYQSRGGKFIIPIPKPVII